MLFSLLRGLLVAFGDGQHNLVAVVGMRFSGRGRSSLCSQKSIECSRHLLERHLRQPSRASRERLAADLLAVRRGAHLDQPQRKSPILGAEVEVAHRQRLLEHRVVRLLQQRHHDAHVVPHVVAPDLVRAVGEPLADARRLAERSSSSAELSAPQATTTMSAEYSSVSFRRA